MTKRPRNIANDILDAVETATSKWTRQRKSEERHPGMVRYRVSRMTKEARTSQKEAAWAIMEEAYMKASANNTLPALARQIFYQARPKIMAMTDDKELGYGYFSQVLLPDYIEEHGVSWNVVYDARGHLEEPHTNRRIGIGTIEIGNYLHAIKDPEVIEAEFTDANIDIVGPANLSGVLFCEKEGFNPLFRATNLANRYDLMIISTKGVSVTAASLLVDEICGFNDVPLFVLHDFDFDGFKILGTLHRDTRLSVHAPLHAHRSRAAPGGYLQPGAGARGGNQNQRAPSARPARRERRQPCRDRDPVAGTGRAKRHDQRCADRNDRAQAKRTWPQKGCPGQRSTERDIPAIPSQQRTTEEIRRNGGGI